LIEQFEFGVIDGCKGGEWLEAPPATNQAVSLSVRQSAGRSEDRAEEQGGGQGGQKVQGVPTTRSPSFEVHKRNAFIVDGKDLSQDKQDRQQTKRRKRVSRGRPLRRPPS